MADLRFHLKVLTPTEIFFEGEITSVVAPGTIGYFGILKNHAPFVTTIEKGNLTWKDQAGAVTTHKVEGGFFEVSRNKAVLLTDKIQ
jgi:F-type H+-transporting ATPase subunit epsilon